MKTLSMTLAGVLLAATPFPASAADPTEWPLTGLPGNLFWAALDPTGETLATLSHTQRENKQLVLWDLKAGTGRVLSEYRDNYSWFDDWQNRLAFADGGKTLLIDREGWVEIWDVPSGWRVKALPDRQTLAEVGPDGWFVTHTPQGGFFVRDSRTGKELARVSGTGENRMHRFVAVAAGGSALAAVDREGRVAVSDPKTGRAVGATPPNARVVCVALTADGRRLAVTARDGLQVWEVRADAPLKLLATEPAPQGVEYRDAVMTADGKTVAALTHDKVTLFDCEALKSGRIISVAGGAFRFGTTNPGLPTVRYYNPDRWVLIDPVAGRAVYDVAPTGGGWLSASADGKRMVVAATPTSVKVLAVGAAAAAKDKVCRLVRTAAYKSPIEKIDVSPKANYMTVSGYGHPTTLFDLTELKAVRQLSDSKDTDEKFKAKCGVFAADEKGLLLFGLTGRGARTNNVTVWYPLPDGPPTARPVDGTWYDTVAIPVGNEFVARVRMRVGGNVGQYQFTSAGQLVAEFGDSFDQRTRPVVSPDGKVCAWEAGKGEIVFRDLAARRPIPSALKSTDGYAFKCYGFTAGGRALAAIDRNFHSVLQVYDLDSGQVRVVKDIGRAFPDFHASFSPTLPVWVSADHRDGSFAIRSLDDGSVLARPEPHPKPVTLTAFLPDGKRFVTHDKDTGTLKLWEIDRAAAAPAGAGNVREVKLVAGKD